MRALTIDQIGRRGVFRVPGKRALVEGVVQELSPEAELVRINGGTWLPNTAANVLTLLPDRPLTDEAPPAPGRRQPRYGRNGGAR